MDTVGVVERSKISSHYFSGLAVSNQCVCGLGCSD